MYVSLCCFYMQVCVCLLLCGNVMLSLHSYLTQRPIVEFAIEDARALKLRADRQLRQVCRTKCTSKRRGGEGMV